MRKYVRRGVFTPKAFRNLSSLDDTTSTKPRSGLRLCEGHGVTLHNPLSPLDISESRWQAQVVELARMCGFLLIYHTHDSRRSARGYPDLAISGKGRYILIECKSETGKLSDAQKEWLRGLIEAGIETYVVRPRHLQQLADVLASPVRFDSALAIETEKEIV